MDHFAISTDAIKFDPARFAREFQAATEGRQIVSISVTPNPGGFDYLLAFKLKEI